MAFDVPTNGTTANDGTGTSLRDQTAIVASLARAANAGQLQGFKNRIINGAMAVDQRNAGAAKALSTSTNFGPDRWALHTSSAPSGTITCQRVATSSPGGARYCMRLARSAGTYAGTIRAWQNIETANCYDLAGKTVMISFRARKGSTYGATTSRLSLVTGTGVDEGGLWSGWTGYTATAVLDFTPTTSWQTFEAPVAVGASVTEIALVFQAITYTGTGDANDYLDITDVQLEVCDTTLPRSTPFERRPNAVELALCERYYEKSYDASFNPGGATQSGAVVVAARGSDQLSRAFVPFKTRKRSTPTVTIYSASVTGASAKWRDTTGAADLGASTQLIGETGFTSYPTANTTSGNIYAFQWVASAEL